MNKVRVITAPTVAALVQSVNHHSLVGWRPVGQPFQDRDCGVWCWAMESTGAEQNGEVRLREPERKARR